MWCRFDPEGWRAAAPRNGLPADVLEIECPGCAAVIRLEAAPFSKQREILCVECEAAIRVETWHSGAPRTKSG